MSKGKVKTVRHEVHSDSRDAEYLCGIEEVGVVESKPKPRPVRSIKTENCEVKVVIDTGASINVMDESIFQHLFANKVKLLRSTCILRSYQTKENPSRPFWTLQWCVQSDERQSRGALKDRPLTRRGILVSVSSVYDPLGLAASFLLSGKQIFSVRSKLTGMSSCLRAFEPDGRSGGVTCAP